VREEILRLLSFYPVLSFDLSILLCLHTPTVSIMKVTVTGTPGTGKTTVLDRLETDFRKIHLTEFIEEQGLGENIDEVTEVDTEKLKQELSNEVAEKEDIIIEGHLAHHIPSDLCIVLRCNPETLKERLSERDYTSQKVTGNVEAEALDVVLSEAVQVQENVLEIDTTDKTIEEVVERVEKGIENKETGYGKVDWSGSFQALF
jgi:adenylate kinase